MKKAYRFTHADIEYDVFSHDDKPGYYTFAESGTRTQLHQAESLATLQAIIRRDYGSATLTSVDAA